MEPISCPGATMRSTVLLFNIRACEAVWIMVCEEARGRELSA
jgi:hypothetical protein